MVLTSMKMWLYFPSRIRIAVRKYKAHVGISFDGMPIELLCVTKKEK